LSLGVPAVASGTASARLSRPGHLKHGLDRPVVRDGDVEPLVVLFAADVRKTIQKLMAAGQSPGGLSADDRDRMFGPNASLPTGSSCPK
jgi:hypothetical protein